MNYLIQTMTCGGCARAVSRVIADVDPGARIEIDLGARRVSVTGSADTAAIEAALAGAGYPAVDAAQRVAAIGA